MWVALCSIHKTKGVGVFIFFKYLPQVPIVIIDCCQLVAFLDREPLTIRRMENDVWLPLVLCGLFKPFFPKAHGAVTRCCPGLDFSWSNCNSNSIWSFMVPLRDLKSICLACFILCSSSHSSLDANLYFEAFCGVELTRDRTHLHLGKDFLGIYSLVSSCLCCTMDTTAWAISMACLKVGSGCWNTSMFLWLEEKKRYSCSCTGM